MKKDIASYSAMAGRKLFTAGPVREIRSVLKAEARGSAYMRTDDFRNYTKALCTKLQAVLETQNPVLLVACSGTGVMEMAVVNTHPQMALVIGNGHFAHRWAEILDSHGFPYHVCADDTYTGVEEYYRHDGSKYTYDVVFGTFCESSTGRLLSEIPKISERIHRNKGIFVLDAVSGLVVNPLKTDEWGVDMVISCAQKGFGVAPGLSIISPSDRALALCRQRPCTSYYFDIARYVEDYQRGSTPYTPPVSLMHALDKSCDFILRQGGKYIQTCAKRTGELREQMKGLGFSITDEAHLGNCITEFSVPDAWHKAGISCDAIVSRLRVMGYETVPKDQKSFRVGNYNIFRAEEIRDFVSAVRTVLRSMERNPQAH